MIDNSFVKKNAIKVMEMPLDDYMKLYYPPYIVEAKRDGEYVMIGWDNGKVTMANKHNSIYTESMLPKYLTDELYDTFKGYSYVLVVAEFCSDKGELYDFLSQRVKLEGNLELWIYDILQVNDKDLRKLPLVDVVEGRKDYLDKLDMLGSNEHVHISTLYKGNCSISVSEEGIEWYFNKMTDLGEEGVVIKPEYEDYYHAHWNKMKKYATDDYVILGITKTESYLKGGIPHSFLIGKFPDVKWGKVGSGLSDTARDMINRFSPALKTGEDRDYIYLKPFFVVEVKYTRKLEHSLREPRILKLRSNKPPEECT